MKINNSKPLNFGNLYCSKTVISKIKKNHNFANAVSEIYDCFLKSEFHKKPHADVIIDFDKIKGLIGIISSKNKKTHFNPQYKFSISSSPKDVSLFAQRLEDLNNCYSVNNLKEYREIQRKALIAMKQELLDRKR